MTADPDPSGKPTAARPRPSAAELLDGFLASRRSNSVKASDAVRAVVVCEAAAQLPATWLDDDELLTVIDPDNAHLTPLERLGLDGLLTVLLFWTSSVALSRGRDSPETIACCRWALRLARHAIKATGRQSYGYACILRDIEYPRVR
ncbi:MAG: hypothetical protein ACTHNT_03145 [Actinomycetales bacterium]